VVNVSIELPPILAEWIAVIARHENRTPEQIAETALYSYAHRKHEDIRKEARDRMTLEQAFRVVKELNGEGP